MKTIFYKRVRENRKRLREAGFAPATIHSWENHYRRPSYETAVKLAEILELDISEIPYYRVQVNTP